MKVQQVPAALPVAGILAGMFFANSVEPDVLGLPFAMFWVVLWALPPDPLLRVDRRHVPSGAGTPSRASRR